MNLSKMTLGITTFDIMTFGIRLIATIRKMSLYSNKGLVPIS
jgi:hypothetical protein